MKRKRIYQIELDIRSNMYDTNLSESVVWEGSLLIAAKNKREAATIAEKEIMELPQFDPRIDPSVFITDIEWLGYEDEQ